MWKVLLSLVRCFACNSDVGGSTRAAKATNPAAPRLRCVFPSPGIPSSTSESNLVSSSVCEMSPVLCVATDWRPRLPSVPCSVLGSSPVFEAAAFRGCDCRASPDYGREGGFGTVRAVPAGWWGSIEGQLRLHTEEDLWFSMSWHNGYRMFSDQKVALKKYRPLFNQMCSSGTRLDVAGLISSSMWKTLVLLEHLSLLKKMISCLTPRGFWWKTFK